jgi:glutathione S-transferase
MKLYYSKGGCSLAVRIILNEIEIPCDYEAVNLKTKQTEKGDDYLKLNPKGAVPALFLVNQEILTENAAIQQYLADEFKATTLLPPINNFKRYRVIEWLNFISTDLHKSCSPLFNSSLSDEIKEQVFKPQLRSKLNFLDGHLKSHKFLLSDQFTLPDSYLFAILRWIPSFKMDLSEWEHLSRFMNDLKKRQSVQTSLEAEGLAL